MATSPEDTKDSIITFSVMNGRRTLSLDYPTFIKATGLDFTEKFEPHPTDTEVKAELLLLGPHDPKQPDVAPGTLLAKAPII